MTVDVIMNIKGPISMRSAIKTNRHVLRKFISTSEWAENIIDQPVTPAVKALLKSIFCLMSESIRKIEQNASRKRADNQGQKAPIGLP